MPRPAHNNPARSNNRVWPRSAKRENVICIATLPTNVAAAMSPKLHPGSENLVLNSASNAKTAPDAIVSTA